MEYIERSLCRFDIGSSIPGIDKDWNEKIATVLRAHGEVEPIVIVDGKFHHASTWAWGEFVRGEYRNADEIAERLKKNLVKD